MTLTYRMTRQQAAGYLDVSTRTIDRYVKKWALSYKKVANKVLLATEEIDVLKEEFDLLNQEPVVATREREVQAKVTPRSSGSELSTGTWGMDAGSISQFAEILTKKDHTIEEKNQLIYLLQRKIGEVENQMHQMLALPEVTEQKEQLQTKIYDLEMSKKTLEQQVKKEKQWNAIYIALCVIIAAVLVLLMVS